MRCITPSLHMHHRLWMPSNAVVSDPYFSSVVLLAHMNGSGASFVDSSSYARTLTAFGNSTQTTGQKFGSACGSFDGTGDYVTAADSSDFAFGSGDFTIEGWINTSSIAAGNKVVLGQWTSGAGANQSWLVERDTATLNFYWSSSGSAQAAGSPKAIGTLTTTTWIHFAVVRSGTSLMCFLNGTQTGTPRNIGTDSLFDSNRTVDIGGYSFSGGSDFEGLLDDIRITKGVARYTSNFTAPTAEFPNL